MQTTSVLVAAAELSPIAKVGGLGDVIGALPKALSQLGVDVKIIIPFYGTIAMRQYPITCVEKNISIPIKNSLETFSLYQTVLPKTKVFVYLVRHPFFETKTIYWSERRKPKGYQKEVYSRGVEDIHRFAFFSRACIETCKIIKPKINIIHCHDWHTAIIPDLLKTIYKNDPTIKNIKTIYTIHNLANQGIAGLSILKYLGVHKNDLKSIAEDAKNFDIDFMAQGLLNADLLTTVSPQYAKEITTEEFGEGLENLLKKLGGKLFGVLNGIDTDFFNPKKDLFIQSPYTAATVLQKKKNKTALQKHLHLAQDKNIFVAGIVSRLVRQKGLDIIIRTAKKLFSNNIQLAVLGSGDKNLEQRFRTLSRAFPNSVAVRFGFDEKLAHQIYAGCDAFLMPSRFEPCGLGQMIAMRYGAIPVVRATGGLKDTVEDGKTGFIFNNLENQEFLNALSRAMKMYYNNPKSWGQIQKNGMKKDFSWNLSAREYFKLYKKLIPQGTT